MAEEKFDENTTEASETEVETSADNEESGMENEETENGKNENDGNSLKDSDKENGRDGEKKSKKSRQKNKKPDKRDEIIEDLTDRLKRSLAEFDNFRKRSEKEKSQMFDIGAKTIIEAVLPVVDNFERGIAGLDPEVLEKDPFAQGMEKTYKQLLKVFEDLGVTEIEALGKEFNPDLHNAVMHEENDDFGENTVSEVFQKGYTYHDQVVRHSMVRVAN